jgi:hypothetical protein
MLEIQFTGLALSLCFGFVAIMVWWLALRFLDTLAGGWGYFNKPSGPMASIKKDARATALYFGLRCIAAALVVGPVLASVRF